MSDPLLEQIYEAGVKDERKKWEERIEQMVAEIKECIKACNDLKNDRVALAIEPRESYDTRIVTYRHAIDIIHKYTKGAEQ